MSTPAEAISELLHSKKFLVGITSTVAAILCRLSVKLNIGIDNEMATQIAEIIVGLAMTYLASQGIADHGKEAATITVEAQASRPVSEPPKPPT
jgi:hypothetical protein